MKKEIKKKLMALYSRPLTYRYSEEEIQFILSSFEKHNFKVLYGVYKKPTTKFGRISVIIDRMANQQRRSLALNNFEIIEERPITEGELLEEAQNFGCRHRKYYITYYKDINGLYEDEKLYGIEMSLELRNKIMKAVKSFE